MTSGKFRKTCRTAYSLKNIILKCSSIYMVFWWALITSTHFILISRAKNDEKNQCVTLSVYNSEWEKCQIILLLVSVHLRGKKATSIVHSSTVISRFLELFVETLYDLSHILFFVTWFFLNIILSGLWTVGHAAILSSPHIFFQLNKL